MNAVLYALLCLIWGSTWLAIKVGLIGVPPFLAAGLRFVLSAALVGAVLAARRKPLRLTRDDTVCVLSRHSDLLARLRGCLLGRDADFERTHRHPILDNALDDCLAQPV